MARRQMPKAGYYVAKSGGEIIMVTGTTKGNKYMRPEFKEKGWANLLWTCVPVANYLATDYVFHETEPRGWWTNNDLDYIVAEIDGGRRPVIPPETPKKTTDSDVIKKQLAALTGVPVSRWKRRTKVEIGSSADVNHDPAVLGGYNLAKGFPEHLGKTGRLFAGSSLHYLVVEEADGAFTYKDASDYIDSRLADFLDQE